MTERNGVTLKATPGKHASRDILVPAFVLFMTGLIVTGLLAAVYRVANPIMEAREARELRASLQMVLPEAATFAEVGSRNTLSGDGVAVPETVTFVWKGHSGEEAVGYVVSVEPKGYGGKMVLIVGIGADGAVTGLRLISQNETPGLGTQAEEPSWLDGYLGVSAQTGVRTVKQESSGTGDIQAITGATVTSRAVTRGVADAVAIGETMLERGVE